MHIPGQFHFHDLNKYISALLLPAIFMQSVEAILIPMTLADEYVGGDIQVESTLLDISESITNKEEINTSTKALITSTGADILPDWANDKNTPIETAKTLPNTSKNTSNTNKEISQINTNEGVEFIQDSRGKKKQLRTIKNYAGKTREFIMTEETAFSHKIDTKTLNALFATGTVVTSVDTIIETPTNLSFANPTTYDLAGVSKEGMTAAFNFGISGEDLIFSKPVKIQLNVNEADGTWVDLQVRHGDEIDFSHRGLTLDASATCDALGNTSVPLTDVYVKNGKITFYTCAASTFILNASGNGNLKLWLKADAGTSCTTDGCVLATWADQSGNANTGTVAGATTPNYIARRWNFNPAVRCNANGYFQTVNDGGIAGDMTLIAVYDTLRSAGNNTFWNSPAIIGAETNAGQLDYALGINTGHLIFKALNGDMLGSYETGTSNDARPHIAIGTRAVSGNSVLYRNGRVVASSPSDANQLTNPTRLGICQHETISANGYLSGYVMEALAYSGVLSSTNLNKISSYLAIKYGIRLDQTTATNYTFSGGAIAWNATAAGTYSGNIAGIARDDGFSLSQRKSQSSTNSSDIIVEYTGATFSSDNLSLVWGNNNGATGSWTTTEAPGGFQRIAREWKFQELNGDIGSVYVSIPLSGLANTGGSTVSMLVAASGTLGDFSGTTTWVDGTLSGSDLYFTYDFTDGDYITFATPYTYTGGSKLLWLQANSGSYIDAGVTLATTDGQTIQQWNDTSASVFNVSQATPATRPIYRKNYLNFNPGLQFTNGTHFLQRATGISWTTNPVFTLYFVGYSQKATGASGTILGFRNNTTTSYPMITTSLTRFNIHNEVTTPTTTYYTRAIPTPNFGVLSMSRSGTGVYVTTYNGSGATATNAALFGAATTGQPMYIGNRIATAANANSFSGVMNEVIVYTGVVNGSEHQRVLSYLACKYGLTLDQTTAYNYLLSNNVVSWNASEDTNYKTNIGCIARDSGFGLYQTGSRSMSNSGDILIEQTGSITDMRVLTWANNNAATGTWTTTEVPGNKIRRFAREWRFQENNGDVGTLKLTYASGSLPSGFTGTLVLVRDDNGNFSSGLTAGIIGTLSGTDWEFITTFDDGEYATIMEIGSYDAQDDSFVTNEDQTGSLDVLTNDTGANIGISSILTLPTNGDLYLSGATGSTLVTLATTDFSLGNLVYVPDSNYCGSDSFYYEMTDTGLLLDRVDTATGTITVTCVNDAPVALDDATATGTEDIAFIIPVIENDTDIDHSTGSLTITGLVQPATGGTIAVFVDSISVTPSLNYCGPTVQTFNYRLQDGSGGVSNIATGSFVITCVNDSPVAVNDSNTTNRNTNVTTFVLANDTDVDHTTAQLSVTGVTSITGGTASISGTGILFTPTAGVCGTGTFTYQALDASGATSNVATGTITINCTNTAPTAVNQVLTLSEDGTGSLNLLSGATDPDAGDTITFSGILTSPSNGSFTTGPTSTGYAVYTPNVNFCGTDTFTFRLKDNFGPSASNTATGTITVTCVNDAPVAVNDTATGSEDTNFTIAVTANDTDVDNTITSITGLTQPSTGATLSITGATSVFVTVNPNYCTSTSLTFNYRAVDASGSTSNIATGSFVITCVNDSPVAVNDSNTTNRNTNVTTFVLANDTDVDHTTAQLSVTGVTSITGGTASISGTGILFTPTAGVCGTGTFTYQALDASGATSNVATGTITINCTNTAPTAVNQVLTLSEDGTGSLNLLSGATDPDAGDTITFSGILTSPSNGSFTTGPTSTGYAVYTPNANFCGTDTFTFRLKDNFGPSASNTATGTITVTCVNDAPVAMADTGATSRNTDTEIAVLTNDEDPDHATGSLTITGLTNGSLGTVSLSGANVVFSPTPALCGTGTFTYQVEDGSGATSNIATGTLTINCSNSAPTAVNDSAIVSEDSTNNPINLIANDTDPDFGDTISISGIVSTTTNGTLSVSGANNVIYTPDADYCGVDTFTYQAEDSFGPAASNIATGTITINCTNDAPVAHNDATATGTEDTIFSIAVLQNDTDTDHATGSLTITGLTQPSTGATLTISGTEIAVTPSQNYCGLTPRTFTYQVEDGSGATSNIATGSLVITCVNDAPVAMADTGATSRNTDTEIAVLTNDQDPDHATGSLTITGLTNGSLGTVSLSGANVVFSPTPALCGTGTFTYQVEDGSGATSNIATGTLTINCSNSAPTAVNDSAIVSEDSTNNPINLIANDTDPDFGDTLSISGIVSTTTNGTLSVSGANNVIYTPDADYCGVDTFTYQAEDTFGPAVSNIATGTITINCTNDAPIAHNDATATGTEDTVFSIAVLQNDTDTDHATGSLTITGLTQPSTGATLTISGTEIAVTPSQNYCGLTPRTFTYQVEDGSGATSNIATGSLVITCVNDAPVAMADTGATSRNTDTEIAVLTNDEDPDHATGSLTITGLTNGSLGTVSLSGANVVFSPTPALCGTGTFTYQVEDGSGATSNIATGTLTINCSNSAPTAVNDSAIVSEDSTNNPINLIANDTDPDFGDTLSISGIVSTTTNGTLSVSGANNVIYTPDADYCGVDTFTYQAEDTFGPAVSNIATGTITINCTNDAPIAHNDATATGTEDTVFSIAVLQNDTDTDHATGSLTITGLTQPSTGATLTISGTEIAVTPSQNYCGLTPRTFTYQVEDGSGATSNSATGSFVITCVNDAPVAMADTGATSRNTDTEIAVLTNDEDPDHATGSLTITGLTNGSLGTVSLSGANVVFSPTPALCGTGTFTYQVEDGSGATSNIATGTLTINCSNSAPTAVNDSAIVSEDSTNNPINLIANDTDPDFGDTLSISGIVSTTTNGTLSVSGANNVIYTPDADYCGVDTFTYQAEDTFGPAVSNIATGTITINCTNDAPIAHNDATATGTEDTVFSIAVLQNDTDTDHATGSLTITGLTQPSTGATLTISGTEIAVTPSQNYCGLTPRTFTYQVEDGSGATSNIATGSLVITCVNDAPVAMADTGATSRNTDTEIAVLTNDQDPDHATGSLTITGLTNGSLGTVSLSGANVVFSPTPALCGTGTFTYQVEDGSGATSNIATGTLTINCSNSAPTAVNDSAIVSEDSTNNPINLIANDTDPDFGDTLSISGIVSTTTNGTLSVSGANNVIYTPDADYCGVDTFTYQAEDTFGPAVSNIATGTITINCTNDAPIAHNDATATGTEDTVFSIAVLQNDTDTDHASGSLTITGLTQPSTGAILSISGTEIAVTPSQNYCGLTPRTFTYQVEDGSGATSNIATGSLVITCVNDAPVAMADTGATARNTDTEIAVLTNDQDPDHATGSLTITGLTNGSLGTVSLSGANVVFSPTPALCGTGTFTYQVEDGSGATSNIATGTLTINCSNSAPTAVNDSAIVSEDSTNNPINLIANDTDPDFGDTLSISGIVSTTTNGTLSVSGANNVIYTPDADYCGVDTFTYQAEDTFGPAVSNIATGTITINCTNDAPIAHNDATATGTEDTVFSIAVLQNDTDTDHATGSLTITGLTQPSTGATLTISGTEIAVTPSQNYCGLTPRTFTYQVEDGSGATSNIATGSLVITCVNDAPVAMADTGATSRNTDTEIAVLTNDEDPDHATGSLTITGLTNGSLGTVSLSGANVVFSPTPALCGTGTFTYQVEDGSGATSNIATGTLTINCSNSAPTAVNDSAIVSEDSTNNPINLIANDTDPDFGDTLSISGIVSTTTNGTLSVSGANNVIYTPDADYCGVDTFTYQAEDTFGPAVSNIATGTITINCTNDAPIAHNDATATGTEDTVFSIAVLQNDTDTDHATGSLTITGLTQPSTGATLTISGTEIAVTPSQNYCGLTPRTFTYQVEDGSGATSNIATGSLVITCVNDAPVAMADTGATSRNTDTEIAVLTNDEDPDHATGSLTITGLTNGSLGTVSLSGANVVFSPTPALCGTGTFTYQVEDGSGATSNIATGTLTINCSNSAPTAVNDSAIVSEDSTNNPINLIANDTDPDFGDTLSISGIVSTTTNGTLSVSGANNVIYTPDADYCGVDTFTYQAEDTFGPAVSNIATGTITINCTNDAPIAHNDATATGTEDTVFSIAVLQNDTDTDHATGSLTITGLTQPSTGATLTISGTEIAVTPSQNYCGLTPRTFTYQVEDGSGATSNIATGSLVITCVNDAPVAMADTGATSRNTDTEIAVLTNDEDPDHATGSLTITGLTNGSLGTVSLSGANVVFSPTPALCGTGTFTYQVEDGSGATSNIATGTLTINCSNSAPTAVNDSAIVSEDSTNNPINLIANDTDPDFGDTLSISGIVSTTTNGTLSVSGANNVIYTPDADYCGVDTFTYQAEDTFGPAVSNIATGTITINCTNDAPIAHNDATATGTEDTVFSIAVLQNDTDTDHASGSLTITGLTQPSTGAILSISGTEIAVTPSQNYCGLTPRTFTYQVEDGSGATSNIATGSLVITCVNDAPVAMADTGATARNTDTEIAVLTNDQDPDHATGSLTITGLTNGSLGTVSLSGANVVFSPTPALCGTGTFTYQVEDGSGATSNIATGTLTINCSNSAPTAVNDSAIVSEDSTNNPINLIANDTDPDFGDTLSISGIVSTTTNGTLSVSGANNVIYTPDADYCGVDTFTYQAEDTFGPAVSNIATGTITINCTNDAPIAHNDATATGTEDTVFSIAVLQNDTDTDHASGSLTITGLTQPSTGAILSISGTEIAVTPSQNYCGLTPRTFTYQVEDGSGATSNIATGSLVITCVNDAPVAMADTGATARNTDTEIAVLTNDQDPDHATGSLTITGLTNGSLGTVSLSGANVVFSPTPALCGTGTFTYQVEDGSGATSNIATGTLTINCSNSAPTAVNDSAIVSEDSTNNPINLIANDTDPDFGDTLSISGIVSTTTNGTLSVSGANNVIYTPDADYCGVDTFTYQAEDTFGPAVSNIATGTITINCTNDAPIAHNDATATGTEDTVFSIAVLQNDTDTDHASGSLTITGLTQPSTGAILSISGTEIAVTPSQNYCGLTPRTFTYQVEDGSGATSNIATGSLVITCVNDAPVAMADTGATARNTDTEIAVLTNDQDPDHATGSLTITGLTNGSLGTVSLSGANVVFSPTPALCGTGTFTYQVEDGSGATSNIATGTLTINCSNSAPTAVNDSAIVSEDSTNNPINLIANDTDPDFGDTLSISGIVSTTTNGTLSVSGANNVIYTPDADYCGVDTFTYQAEDTFGPAVSNIATGTITINCTNDAPIAHNDATATGTEDTVFSIAVLQNDTDTDHATGSLTITGLTQPSTGATLTISGTEIAVTPSQNYCGLTPRTFTYQVEDGSGATSNIATGSLVITCVNDAPVAMADTGATSRNTDTEIAVLTNDEDPDHATGSLTITGLTNGSLGTVSLSGANVVFSPTPALCGTGTFTYQVEDGSGATSNIATGTLTINCSNSAPTAVNDSAIVSEDSTNNPINLIANDTDPDFGDTLSISGIVSTTTNGTLSVSGANNVIYTPDADYCGVDTFTYQAEDTFGPAVSNIATGTITINCTNDAPIAHNDATATGTEDTVFSIAVLQNDTDTDHASGSLTITGLTQPSTGAILSISGTEIAVTPSQNYCGLTPRTFTYQVEDGSGATSNIATGSLVITCVNDAPVAMADTGATARNTDTEIAVLTNDQDPDHATGSLTITGLTNGSLGTVSLSGANVVFSPTPALCGTGTFTYQVEDGSGATSNIATGTLTINCSNSAPTAVNDSAIVSEDSTNNPINLIANDTDPDFGDTLSISGIVSTTTNGTLSVSGANNVIYTPDADYCGVDTFTYQAEDTFGPAVSNIATGTITINCTNDAPIAHNDATATGTEDTVFSIAVLQNDTDTDHASGSLTITGLTQPSTGAILSISGTEIAVTPSQNYCGLTPRTFTYQVEDGSGATSNIATGSLVITCVNDAPVAMADTGATARNTDTEIAVLTNDQDPDHATGSLTITGLTNGSLGTVSLSGANVVFSPTPALCGTGTFTYQVEDGSGATSNIATGTLTINCSNSAPTAVNDSAIVSEDSTNNPINLIANDTDPDFGDTLSISGIVSTTTNGTLSVSGANNVIYTPDADYCGVDTFTYQAEDTFGPAVSNIATGTITINCTNDAPIAHNDATATGTEDTVFSIAVLQNDTDTDHATGSLTITGLTQPSTGATLTISGTEIAVTPSQNYCGLTPRTFTYQVEDGSGATSNSATGSFVITCVPSEPPTITEISTDTNAPYTISSQTPRFIGTGEVDDIISVYSSTGYLLATGSVTSTGFYSIILPLSLPDNNYLFTLTSTDYYGLESSGSVVALMIDTIPPVLNNLTNYPNPINTGSLIFTGLTESGTSIEIYTATGTPLCTTTASSTGYFICGSLIHALPDGVHTISISICDTMITPNCTVDANTVVTIDTISPEVPTLIQVSGDTSGPIYTTSYVTGITIVGTGEANSSIEIMNSTGVLLMTGMISSTGSFVITLSGILSEGSYSYLLRSMDSADNYSLPISYTLIVDTSAPSGITYTHTNSPSSTGSIIFSGNTDSGSFVRVSILSGAIQCTTTASSTGYFTCGPFSPPLSDGTYQLIIESCDTSVPANCITGSGTTILVEHLNTNIPSTAGSTPSSSNVSSSVSLPVSNSPSVSPGVFPPVFTLSNPVTELQSAPTIFEDNFMQILPTQSLVSYNSVLQNGTKVFDLKERVTDYVCPQIVQMFTLSEIQATDIPRNYFIDDVKSLIMFRGLEENEKLIGQTYEDYKKFGIVLNDESFEPYRSITRAEFVKMLVRSLSCRYSFIGVDSGFPDVEKDMWYAEYITFAAKNGWINGYNDGTFRPNSPITRAEVAKILARSIKLKIPPRTESTFEDVPDESVFVPYIETLKSKNIITGKTPSTFEPNTIIVRTEAARIIYKTFLGGGKFTKK